MGLMQEGLNRSGEIRNAFSSLNLNRSEIKTNRLPITETGLEVKIREISRMFSVEEKEGKATEEPQSQETNKNGFEPFINGDANGENNLFVNLYGGNFAQKMELNRKRVERVLKIAHLNGQVFLTTLSPNRQRSMDGVNPDGSVSAKRFIFFGEKTEEDVKDNPLSRVVAVPQGWRIEINDQKLSQELMERKLSGKKLQRTFVGRFNGLLKDGIRECVRREKLSSEKDKFYIGKLVISTSYCVFTIISSSILMQPYSAFDFAYAIGSIPIVWGMSNILNLAFGGLGYNIITRNIDHPLEIFMLPVELDKVARTFVFLQGKGRTLVKETREEK